MGKPEIPVGKPKKSLKSFILGSFKKLAVILGDPNLSTVLVSSTDLDLLLVLLPQR